MEIGKPTSKVQHVAVWGEGSAAAARRAAVEKMPGVRVLNEGARDGDVDAVFIAGPTAGHFEAVEAAVRNGLHFFLEWPPAVSIPECEAMVRLAEEAGVEGGVSRPLRFHPALAERPPGWRPALIQLQVTYPPGDAVRWSSRLADAVDLCCALARSSSVRRIDAEAVRGSGARPEAAAFALRFHSGTYAQVGLREGSEQAEHLFAGGGSHRVAQDLSARGDTPDGGENALPTGAFVPEPQDAEALLTVEVHAFLNALRARRGAPVSVLDGLHTMRLVERLMEKLR